jgi:hypothetical protein
MDPFTIFLLTLAATSTGVSARGQYVAGKQQEIELKRQAEEEKLAAQAREIERRQELNRVLAANIAAQSQAGITGEGTPASLALASAKQAGLSEATISLSDRLRQATLRRQAAAAKQTGYISATSTLLRGAGQVASIAQGAGE